MLENINWEFNIFIDEKEIFLGLNPRKRLQIDSNTNSGEVFLERSTQNGKISIMQQKIDQNFLINLNRVVNTNFCSMLRNDIKFLDVNFVFQN